MGLTQQDRCDLMAAAGGLADAPTLRRARLLLDQGSTEAVTCFESARKQAELLSLGLQRFEADASFELSNEESTRLSERIQRRYAWRTRWHRVRWAAVIGIILVPATLLGWLLRPATSFTVALVQTSHMGTTDEVKGRLRVRRGDMILTTSERAIGRLPDGSLMVLAPHSTVVVEAGGLSLRVGMVYIESTTPVRIETEMCRLEVTGKALFQRHEVQGNVVSVWSGQARLTRGDSSTDVTANRRLEFGRQDDRLIDVYPMPIWITHGIQYAQDHGI